MSLPTPGTPGTPGTLLLVDDEPSILVALRRTLAKHNYNLLTTDNPREVLSILARESVDVLISDIDMPHMTGIELVAAVRRAHPGVVRILLTGRGSMQSALQAINDGEVYRYLTKPWNNDELAQTIDQALVRCGELRRLADTERQAARVAELWRELEAEHPGITSRSAIEDGFYSFDDQAVREFARSLPTADLRALADAPSPPHAMAAARQGAARQPHRVRRWGVAGVALLVLAAGAALLWAMWAD